MAEQSFTVNIPVEIDSLNREVLGREIIDFIVNRTQSGLDKNNRPFKGYSDAYVDSVEFKAAGKSSTVNLSLTGDMLAELSLLRHAPGTITIGYENGTDENQQAEWMVDPQRNRATGKTRPKRDFLGIAQKDLDVLVKSFLPGEQTEETRVQREARAIINRILGGS